MPPPRLRVLVAGSPELRWFLGSGKAQTSYLRQVLSDIDHPLERMDAILDFGCGCGRMTRWWSELRGPDIYACDCNQELATWCSVNLAFARVTKTELEPPLPYRAASFDLVYAFSVFTHLTAELATRWIGELKRVVKPGGLVWFTVHGASYRARLLPEQKRRFDAGEVVVWFPEIQGTNLCAAYWPHACVKPMLGDGFELLIHLDSLVEAPMSQAAQIAPHDAYLVRRL